MCGVAHAQRWFYHLGTGDRLRGCRDACERELVCARGCGMRARGSTYCLRDGGLYGLGGLYFTLGRVGDTPLGFLSSL